MKKINFILIIILAVILRLYHLNTNPPSLYWDEASLGFNAYTILKNGIDEHGEKYPLARFIAFGDYKPPGYIYSAVPSVWLFGLNEFAVRLPSALAGISMVVITFYLVGLLGMSNKLSLLAAFLISISPWSLHLSRTAFEGNLAAAFNLAAVLFYLRSTKKGSNLLISMLFFLASFYTFNANRIIAPLLYIVLSLIFLKSSLKNLKWHFFSAVLALVILFPSLGFLTSRESRLRFQEVSIFNNLKPVLTANSRINLDGNTLISKIIHNRRILYFSDYLKHYSDNFAGRFLFTHGDVNPRLHVQGMGQLYFVELPFFVIGIIYLILRKRKIALFLASWMLITVIPAGTARETPHALRIASILPTYQIVIAVGILAAVQKISPNFSKYLNYLIFFIISAFIFNILYYLHLYHIHFPRDWSGEFQYGTKELVEYINQKRPNYDKIFVTPSIGRPYIFFAFYTPYDPQRFLKERQASRDWFGFWQVNSLGKLDFNLQNASTYPGKALLASGEENFPENFRLLKIIRNLAGNPVFYLAQKL